MRYRELPSLCHKEGYLKRKKKRGDDREMTSRTLAVPNRIQLTIAPYSLLLIRPPIFPFLPVASAVPKVTTRRVAGAVVRPVSSLLCGCRTVGRIGIEKRHKFFTNSPVKLEAAVPAQKR